MKNYLLSVLFISGLAVLGHAQLTTFLVDEPFASPTGHVVYLDSLSADTLWQVGLPQKNVFTGAYSIPFAIVTDTLNPYPPNTLACFYVNIIPPDSLAYFLTRIFGVVLA